MDLDEDMMMMADQINLFDQQESNEVRQNQTQFIQQNQEVSTCGGNNATCRRNENEENEKFCMDSTFVSNLDQYQQQSQFIWEGAFEDDDMEMQDPEEFKTFNFDNTRRDYQMESQNQDENYSAFGFQTPNRESHEQSQRFFRNKMNQMC